MQLDWNPVLFLNYFLRNFSWINCPLVYFLDLSLSILRFGFGFLNFTFLIWDDLNWTFTNLSNLIWIDLSMELSWVGCLNFSFLIWLSKWVAFLEFCFLNLISSIDCLNFTFFLYRCKTVLSWYQPNAWLWHHYLVVVLLLLALHDASHHYCK